jgi:hypothetical protein
MNAKKLVMAELLSLAAAHQMQHIGVFGNALPYTRLPCSK